MFRYLKIVLFLSGCVAVCNPLFALTKHTGLWTGAVVVGPARFGPEIKYYADAQLKLIDDPYKFDEVYSSIGLGKQVNKNWLLFIVNRLSAAKQITNGAMNYEYRLWQEANWRQNLALIYDLSTRSRLEERKRFSQPAIAVRFRQRIMLRKILAWWRGHSFVVYDELFFNLNRPVWVVDSCVEQNRFFIGFGTIVSKKTSVDIGYLNKYQFGNARQMTNILAINFNITGKSNYYKE